MNKQEIQQMLEEKRDYLLDKLQKIESDGIRNPISADVDDRSQELENDEVLNELDNVEAHELKQVNAALVRLENGEYGLCSDCGAEIGQPRLKAIPYATICINCANESES
jgi:RNA polymerase-binding protein DksA